jgi:hypothetical protein
MNEQQTHGAKRAPKTLAQASNAPLKIRKTPNLQAISGIAVLPSSQRLSRCLLYARTAQWGDVYAIELTALQFPKHRVWAWSRC